jgi:hypothetical protein
LPAYSTQVAAVSRLGGRQPALISVPVDPTGVAASPDGCWAFAALSQTDYGGEPRLAVLAIRKVASGTGCGSPNDVGDLPALGVLPASLDDRLSDRGGNQRFKDDQEPGPEQSPRGPQGQRGRNTSAVGDPACGQHRCGRGKVNRYRNEGQS